MSAAEAQRPSPAVGAVADPSRHVDPMPAEVAVYFEAVAKARTENSNAPAPTPEQMDIYRNWQVRVREQDFAQLSKYEAANAQLGPPSGRRVVYFGDSITELWGLHDPAFFDDDSINRGISGQTTLQMLGRFRADVIDLNPRVVHILAGTNDVAGNTGPTSVDRIAGNIATMVELAQLHGVSVVLGSELPCARFQFQPHLEPIGPLNELNARLRRLARDRSLIFIDYFTPLADLGSGFDTRYSDDGLHPTAAGYAIMRPLAKEAVERACQEIPNLRAPKRPQC